MVVQHNMQAANASRMLNITTGQQGKSTEKLSSGYRINRAADDAAGLSISEKMRRQIRGLSQASTNASDGVSAVQTAEGALNEVHDMLQRMNELAVQAANGSNSESDRQDLQNEITQLTAEIDRISQTTRFNEGYLLKGMESKSVHAIAAHDAGLPGYLTEIENSDPAKTNFALTERPLKDGDKITIAGVNYEIGKQLSENEYENLDYAKRITMNSGDTITTVADGRTYSLTDSVTESEVISHDYIAGDTITTADGIVYKYYVMGSTEGCNFDGTGKGEGGVNLQTGWYKQSSVEGSTPTYQKLSSAEEVQIMAAGSTYTTSKGVKDVTGAEIPSTADAGTHHLIVKELRQGEVSSYHINDYEANTVLSKGMGETTYTNALNQTSAQVLLVGDRLSISGNTTVVNDNAYIGKNYADVKEMIESLQAGTKVTVSNASGNFTEGQAPESTTYTIIPDSEKSDANAKLNRVTRSELIDLLKEGSRVNIASTGQNDTDMSVTGITNAIGSMSNGNTVTIDGTTYKKTTTAWDADGPAVVTEVQAKISKIETDNAAATVVLDGTEYVRESGSDVWTISDNTLDEILATIPNGSSITVTGGDAAGNLYKDAAGDWHSGTPGYTPADDAALKAALKAATSITYTPTGETTTKTIKPAYTDAAAFNGAITAGSTIKIGNDPEMLIVAATSNPEASVTGQVKEGASVVLNGEAPTTVTADRRYTVAGATAINKDAISVKEAYNKIKDELEKASSIGAQTAARVTDNHDGTFTIEQGTVSYADPLIFDLHVGSEADMTNKIVVQLNSMNATSLGLSGLNIVDDTGMAATYVIDVISDALAKVSAQRAELGAVQNRLEHSIANLDNVVENTEASESRIRDTDMADEMVKYSKNNILQQAGQSMLAQANQATQGVLSLLQ